MAKEWDSMSKELYITKKKETRRALAVGKEIEGKKIANLLERNKSEGLKCLWKKSI